MIGITASAGVLAGIAFGLWGGLAVAAAAVASCAVTRCVPSPLAIVIVALLTMSGIMRHPTLTSASPAMLAEPVDLSSLVVVSNPNSDGEYQQFVATGAKGTTPRLCIVSRSLPVVGVGDQISVSGDPSQVRDEPQRIQRYLASRGCEASVFAGSLRVVATGTDSRWAFGQARRMMSERLRSLAPGDSGALLAGLVVGDDSALSTAREQAFVNSGTTRLTAVSGANLAMIAGMLLALGRASVGSHRLGWQIVTIAGIWAFAFVTGAEPPAVRAAIVASAALVAVRFGRAADFPTLILIAGAAMVLVEPEQVTRPGFQLSVAAALALAVVMPGLARGGVGGTLAGVLAATAVAQIATLPLLLAVFGTVSAFSIPANVLVAPLAGAAMPLAGIAGGLGVVSPTLGALVIVPASLAADLTVIIVEWLGGPESSIAVGVPPLASTFVLAMTCAGLVLVLANSRHRKG